MSELPPATVPIGALREERHVLVLDLSRSMLAPLPDPSGTERQKIEVARAAVHRILRTVSQNGTPFGLVSFTDTARVAIPIGEIRNENLPYVESLISLLAPSGRSAIWDALALGADLLRDGAGAVRGTLVLVTDGWDNASTRFAPPEPAGTGRSRRADLLAHLAPPGSNLTLRVIGIGHGGERDKGVDAGRINQFLANLGSHARASGVLAISSFQEVDNAVDLFQEIVHAFLDVEEYSGARTEPSQDDIARHAAQAARALKEPQEHAVVSRLARPTGPPSEADMPYSEAPSLEVDVISTANGLLPPYARERYGPLGDAVDAYLTGDYPAALRHLERAKNLLPPVSYSYWQAKVAFARGDSAEAARSLLAAWDAAESVPRPNRPRVVRRLALLQAQLQKDPETETLVRFLEETEGKLEHHPTELRENLMALFDELLELRGTYQLTRAAASEDASAAARRHEEAVQEIFGGVQDLRLENTSGDRTVDGALDFIEICLAEMR
jgi:hypothetical protein